MWGGLYDGLTRKNTILANVSHRSMLRVMRVAAMHLLQIPVPGCSTQYAATCASASAMAQPHRMATLLAFPGGILAAVATAVLAEAPLFVDRVLGDMVMAPFLIGLPLWGCVDTLIQLALPTVQYVCTAVEGGLYVCTLEHTIYKLQNHTGHSCRRPCIACLAGCSLLHSYATTSCRHARRF